MNFAQLFFSFTGRINRGKYWLGILVYVIIALVLATLGYAAGETMAFQLLNIIVNIGLFIGGLALAAKRLHDRDKSAWWILLFCVAPGVLIALGAFFATYGSGMEETGSMIAGGLFSLIGFVLLVWAFVEIGGLRGTVGPNRFGPDPLDVARPVATVA
jgi:uncharacterized membrane protein YhaH (DUF805 family)